MSFFRPRPFYVRPIPITRPIRSPRFSCRPHRCITRRRAKVFFLPPLSPPRLPPRSLIFGSPVGNLSMERRGGGRKGFLFLLRPEPGGFSDAMTPRGTCNPEKRTRLRKRISTKGKKRVFDQERGSSSRLLGCALSLLVVRMKYMHLSGAIPELGAAYRDRRCARHCPPRARAPPSPPPPVAR